MRWPAWRDQKIQYRRPACATWLPACVPPIRSINLLAALTLSCLPSLTRYMACSQVPVVLSSHHLGVQDFLFSPQLSSSKAVQVPYTLDLGLQH